MRTASAPELALLAATAFNVYHRTWVANADGTFKNLSSLGGFDWVTSIEIEPGSVDVPVAGLTLRVKRDMSSTLSLSPIRTDSTINVKDDNVTFGSITDAGRDIYVETAVVAPGSSPAGGDWKEMFRGIIDTVNWESPEMVIRARDLGCVLQDTWYTQAQGFTYAGRAVEDVIQDFLNAAPTLGITLYVPTSPGFLLTQAKFEVEPVMDALVRLAQSIGWDIRYKWHQATTTWRLTLSDPNRAKVTPDATIGPSQYIDVTNIDVDRTGVRNLVTWWFGPADDRGVSVASDGTSQSKYGIRSIVGQEASDSPIDSQTEADALTAAILSDLKDPKADQSIEMLYYWPVEFTDLLRFSSNGVHYNANQDLAVVGIRHRLGVSGGTQFRTTIDVRGKPAGAYDGWVRRAIYGQLPPGTPNMEARALLNFRVTAEDATTRTYGWDPGADVTAVWIYDRLLLSPPSSNPWPSTTDTPDSVYLVGLNSYVATKPSDGYQRYLQFEPRLANVQAGELRRAVVEPVTSKVVAQGTVSIDADGVYGFSVDLSENVLSYRYAVSTSSYPDDATTAASGIVRDLSASTDTVNSVGTLTFGQTVYITIVPFLGASASGLQRQPVHIRGAYVTFTATKTQTYAAANWKEYSTTRGMFFDSNGNPTSAALPNPLDSHILSMLIVVPNGVTITSVAVEGQGTTANGLDTYLANFHRKVTGGTSTSLATGGPSPDVGWNTGTMSISESVTANRTYFFTFSWISFPGGAHAADGTLGDVSVTYTMGVPTSAL